MPLVHKSFLAKREQRTRGSIRPFRFKGEWVVLHPLEIVSVANESLGELVGSLSEEGDAIIAALDALLTRWH